MRLQRGALLGLSAAWIFFAACGGDEPQAKAPETIASAPPPPDTAPPPPPATAPPPPPAPPPPTFAELEKNSWLQVIDGLNRHDAKRSAASYADYAVVHMAGAPADQTGPDAIAQGYQRLLDAFPDLKAEVAHAFVKGDTIILVWNVTGTHTGEFMGVKGTQKPVGVTGASVLRFAQDGHIQEERRYWDPPTILKQIGAGPKGEAARPIPTSGARQSVMVPADSDTERKNIETTRTWLASLEKKSADAFLAPLTDDTVFEDHSNVKSYKGKDNKAWFTQLTTAFPDLKIEATNVWGFGDFVIAETIWSGTNKGAFFGKPATKKTGTEHALDLFHFRDGKIAKAWTFVNSYELASQLGWVKAPGEGDKSKDAKPPAAPPAKK